MRIARALSVVGVLMALLNSCSQRIPLTTPPDPNKYIEINPVQGKTFMNQDDLCLEITESAGPTQDENTLCAHRLEFWDHVNKVNVMGTSSWIGLSYDLVSLLKLDDADSSSDTDTTIPPGFTDFEQVPALAIALPGETKPLYPDSPLHLKPVLIFEILDNGTALKNKSGQVFVQNSEF